MISFEQEIKAFFATQGYAYSDNSGSFNLLDFTIRNLVADQESDAKKRDLYVEVKEKRQRYNVSNWPGIPAEDEVNTFIVDELSCRKILGYAPFSGLLVRDNIRDSYYWFSVLDLFLMPKRRVNRPIKKDKRTSLKGKIIVDFRNAFNATNLQDIFKNIQHTMEDRRKYYIEQNECYGNYHNEEIPVQGIVRTSDHWDTDVSETR